ncbi:MFS transporter [Phycicoccus sp. HDW14]|uniref:MFS transporter n=1 Tax=Phycicoccus sp. HDW14 TaxID=2714941 RepID=UPI0035302B3D
MGTDEGRAASGPVGRLVDIVVPPRMGTAFRWNLASSWVGQIGDGIALAAGPLLVATQTRSPVLIAAAAVVQRLPGLVIGLYAGAVADRVDRRRVVMAANAARVVVLLLLVGALLTGTLSIGLLLGLLLLVGTAEVFADTGWRAVLPMLVRSEDLGLANARQMSGFLVGNQLIGPAVGAALFALGSAVPFGVQVLSLLLAIGLFARVRLPAVEREHPDQHVGRDIVDGLRWIAHNAPVRTLTVVILVFNITWGAPWGVLVYWAQERLGVDAIGFGLLATASAVGGIVSVLSYGWLERHVALARLMKACLLLEVLTHLALAVTTVWAVALGIMVLFGGTRSSGARCPRRSASGRPRWSCRGGSGRSTGSGWSADCSSASCSAGSSPSGSVRRRRSGSRSSARASRSCSCGASSSTSRTPTRRPPSLRACPRHPAIRRSHRSARRSSRRCRPSRPSTARSTSARASPTPTGRRRCSTPRWRPSGRG